MADSFAVSNSGSSVQTAVGPQQLLSMNNPFTKLDTTKIISFQTIQLLFNTEPPQPPNTGPFYSNTLVYQFAHGYEYVPAIWMDWQNNSPAFPGDPGPSSSNMILYPNGDDSAGVNAYDAIVNNTIDIANTTLVALEQYNNAGSTSGATQALLYTKVVGPNVNLYLMKQTIETVGGSVIPLFLIGVILDIRIYVFTEPATTSTY